MAGGGVTMSMQVRVLLMVILAALLVPMAALADDVETLFKQANARAEARDYDGALELYQKALAISPDEPNIVYNAALTAYLGKKYDASVKLWLSYRKLAPDDWRGLAKLVQAYEAAGRHADAEASIKDLYAMRGKGVPDLVKQKSFVRDQLVLGGHRYLVYQFFEVKPAFQGHLYDFVEIGDDGRAARVFYVQYDEETSQMMRERGDKTAELYFFDSVGPNGSHASYTRRNGRPDYLEAKRIMVPIIEGKVPPASSTTRK